MTYERGTKFEAYFEEKIKSDPELAWEYVKAMEGEIELLSRGLQKVRELDIDKGDIMWNIADETLKEWESK